MLSVGYIKHALDYHYIRGSEVGRWTLEYLRNGQITLQTATGRDRFEAVSVALVPPHVAYSLTWAGGSGPWDEFYAFFDPLPHWNALLSWPPRAHGLGVINISDSTVVQEVEDALQAAIKVQHSARPQRHLLAGNALERALLSLDEINPSRGYTRRDPRIEEILTFIERHYEGSLSLPLLARQVHLSPSRFSHLFKQQMKLAPMQYVEQYRLERAAEKLLDGYATIEQVSAAVGFTNPFHFSTRFRHQFGQSPRRYRRNPA